VKINSIAAEPRTDLYLAKLRWVCTHVHNTYTCLYSWPHRLTHTALAQTQTEPVASSCSPLWLTGMKVCQWNMYQCMCTLWIPPAAGLKHPVFPVAGPESQPSQLLAAGHVSPTPAPYTSPLAHSRAHTHTWTSLRWSPRSRLLCTSWSSLIIARAHSLSCTPALAPAADTGAPAARGCTPAAARRPPCVHTRAQTRESLTE